MLNIDHGTSITGRALCLTTCYTWASEFPFGKMSCNLNACSASGYRGDRVCKIGPEPFLPQRAAAVGGPEWTDDSEALQCHDCARNFTLFRRKHHCRLRNNSNSIKQDLRMQCEFSELNLVWQTLRPDILYRFCCLAFGRSHRFLTYIPSACCHEKRPLPKYDYMKPGVL